MKRLKDDPSFGQIDHESHIRLYGFEEHESDGKPDDESVHESDGKPDDESVRKQELENVLSQTPKPNIPVSKSSRFSCPSSCMSMLFLS
jgi:hypothetical protein